jgi:hypothetical protein
VKLEVVIAAVVGLAVGLAGGWVLAPKQAPPAPPAPVDRPSTAARALPTPTRTQVEPAADNCGALRSQVAALRSELEQSRAQVATLGGAPSDPIAFDDLPELTQPEAIQQATTGLQEWMGEQDPALGYRFHGLDCSEAPCIATVEWDNASLADDPDGPDPSALLLGEVQALLGYYPAVAHGFGGLPHPDGSGDRHVSWLALFDPGAIANEGLTAELEAAALRRSQEARGPFMEDEGP